MLSSKHVKIAGALQVAQSFMSLLPGTAYVILYNRNIRQGSQDVELLMLLMLAAILFIGVCQLWFGIALTLQKQWTTRVWGFICCAPGLFAMPHVFSAYTLWVLIEINRKDATQPNSQAPVG